MVNRLDPFQAKGSKLLIVASVYDCIRQFQSESMMDIKTMFTNLSASNLPKDDGFLA